MKTLLSAIIGVTISLFAIGGASADGTPRERQVALLIESKTLADALDQWAVQTGFNIVVPNWPLTRSLPAPTLRGTFGAQEALKKLLHGTPLTYVWVSENAVAIREKVSPTAELELPASTDSDQTAHAERLGTQRSSRLRLAQAEPSATPRYKNRSATSRLDDGDDVSEGDVVEEVIVTGTHIRGLRNNTASIIVLDRDYIDSTGLSTTTALIESLPQNFAQTNQSRVLADGVSSTAEQGSAISLRGLGEGTTLVLMNGRRIAPGFSGAAVDISALPLSAVERVEVLTDGASALYGSDAIGGVVNFILRSDFDGVETRLSAGNADGGVDQRRVSQLVGHAWETGNALVSLEYHDRDLLRARDRDFIPLTSTIGSLYPEDENYSAMVTGQQELADTVSAFVDALYTHRDTYNEGGRSNFNVNNSTTNPQFVATAGIKWNVGADWLIETALSHADNKQDQTQRSSLFAAFGGAVLRDSRFKMSTASVKADGSLFSLSSGDIRAAVGADWRSESLFVFQRRANATRPFRVDSDQIVRSAFAELYAPLMSDAQSRARLELSVAARYDDYSTFGSSVDPQVGLMWSPAHGIRLRGSYGSSYKAPKLFDYDMSLNSAQAFYFIDPASPTGTSHQLIVAGRNPDGYVPQKSKNFSVGFDIEAIRNVRLSANYYDIKYRDQLAQPPGDSAVILGNPAAFGQLIIRDPSVQQVNDYIALARQPFLAFNPDFTPNTNFDPSTVDVIVDESLRNMSETRTSGIDASMQYQVRTGVGTIRAGIAGTHILKLEQRLTSTSAASDRTSTIYNPPDLRLRGSLAWLQDGWNVNVFVNHSDSYVDNRIVTAPARISSYTTVDMHLAWELAHWFVKGFWSGVTVSLNAQNLLDRDPPSAAVITPMDMGFDPNNANPMGRFVSLEFAKSW